MAATVPLAAESPEPGHKWPSVSSFLDEVSDESLASCTALEHGADDPEVSSSPRSLPGLAPAPELRPEVLVPSPTASPPPPSSHADMLEMPPCKPAVSPGFRLRRIPSSRSRANSGQGAKRAQLREGEAAVHPACSTGYAACPRDDGVQKRPRIAQRAEDLEAGLLILCRALLQGRAGFEQLARSEAEGRAQEQLEPTCDPGPRDCGEFRDDESIFESLVAEEQRNVAKRRKWTERPMAPILGCAKGESSFQSVDNIDQSEEEEDSDYGRDDESIFESLLIEQQNTARGAVSA